MNQPSRHLVSLTWLLCWLGRRGNAWPHCTGTLSLRNGWRLDRLLTYISNHPFLSVRVSKQANDNQNVQTRKKKRKCLRALNTVFSQSLSAAAPTFLHSWRTVLGFLWKCPFNWLFALSKLLHENILTCQCTDRANVLGRHQADLPSNQTNTKETTVNGKMLLISGLIVFGLDSFLMHLSENKLYLMTTVSVCQRNGSWQHSATAGKLQELIRLGCTHGHVQDTLKHILLSTFNSRWIFYHNMYY